MLYKQIIAAGVCVKLLSVSGRTSKFVLTERGIPAGGRLPDAAPALATDKGGTPAESCAAPCTPITSVNVTCHEQQPNHLKVC